MTSLRQRLAGILELPKDVVFDLPRVTIIGALQVTVENHKGILQYSPESVLIAMNRGRIHLKGNDLVIGVIHEEELTVTGEIESVSIDRID